MNHDPITNTVHVPFLDLSTGNLELWPEILRRISRVVEKGDFINGAETEQFEASFARYLGVESVVGVGNCLDALRLSLAALGIGSGDEVLVPANTFIATALAVSAVGARPVFVDCDEHTYMISVPHLTHRITPRTRAIIPVHLTGQAAPMEAILEIAKRHNLIVVEDVAQAPGATCRGKQCGAWGQAGCFSFYPAKNLGAFGDAGAISTNDAALAKRLRQLRNYGQEVKYIHREKGLNSRLDTLQAAVLNVKLTTLDEANEQRRLRAARYRELLHNVGDVVIQTEADYGTHTYHLFVITSEHRDVLQQHLLKHGIQTLIHYPVPIHLQAAYAELGHRPGDFPVAERLAKQMLSLPIYPDLSWDKIDYVASTIRQWFAGR